MLFIPALRRLRPDSVWVQSDLYSKSQDSQDYIVKACPKMYIKGKRKKKSKSLNTVPYMGGQSFSSKT